MRFLIFILLFSVFVSCEMLTPALSPPDFVYSPPQAPLVVDSCQQLHVVTDPKFCGWFTTLDVLPSEYKFYYQHGNNLIQINIDSFLMTYGGESITYYSGINVCGIWTGHDSPKNILNANVFLRDGTGIDHSLSFSPYRFDFQGALTFDQFFSEMKAHASARYIGLRNTAFTCDQYAEIWDFWLSDCKDLSHLTIDIRFLICPIDDDVKSELKARHATIIE